MADYGHELLFGTFITPQNEHPDEVVALAQLTEQAGLDLVTFQDHPYQPAFLDTWTLLSYVAAKTERVHLAGNVINLPLRQPAVLARAAASLDLLSGGRFELGLGGGAFWDPIAAMGGPRRTPGESVEALEEAIDIIRAIWDPDTRRGIRIEGKHYRVVGARRGPEPHHEMGIWLGVLKPRMLRLLGRKADGWLPSLSYLQPGDLQRGNQIIDKAATAAGRDPREIRRLLNVSVGQDGVLAGPPEQWVENLLPLVIDDGVSAFILTTDDPRAIELWGTEVAPALRDAVANARQAAGTVTGAVVRSPKALALRREGIDYERLPESLRRRAVEPGDRRYAKVRSTYMRHGSPGLVLEPRNPEEVIEALGFAREQEVPLSIRSGGHGISGRSTNDGGIVIDMGKLNRVELLDPTTGRFRVGPGARWGHVAQALNPHGLAMSSGDFGNVGVGGLATTGGIGLLDRKHGLTIDHLVAAEIVLGDGTLLRVDADHHPDLLWAIRGAGGNFGIVTSFELNAYPLPDVVFAQMVFDGANAATLLQRWGDIVEKSPRELTSFLYGFSRRGSHPVIRVSSVYAGDDVAAAGAALTPMLELGPVLDQQAALVPYAAILPADDPVHQGGAGEPLLSNGLATHLTAELSTLVAAALEDGIAPWLSIRAVGGAVNDLPPEATAYAHRHQNFNVSSVGMGVSEDVFRSHWDDLRPHLDGLYLSFETDPRPERLNDAFPGQTLTKLARLKAQYDPNNVFNQNHPIPPASDWQEDEASASVERAA